MAKIQADQERFELLLMKALDDVLADHELTEFNKLLEKSPSYKQEHEAMKKIREITKEMSFRTPSDVVWDMYWSGIYNRIERGIGWLACSVGAIILLTYGLLRFVESVIFDTKLALFVKIGILMIAGGLSTLLVSVIRERFFMFKKDPYKEIKR